MEPRTRPDVLNGNTYKVLTGCGNAYITITHDSTGISEVFILLGKPGQCGAAQTDAIGRLCSINLRAGVKVEAITDELKEIRCSQPQMFPLDKRVLSCADAVAIVLSKEKELLKP